MPKFGVSTTLKDPEWNNTTVLDSGDATVQVRKLKEEFDGELQVPGSHRLVQELIESDLVDQINLMVFPVILGTGKKVFEEKPERRNRRWSGPPPRSGALPVACLEFKLIGASAILPRATTNTAA